MNIIITMAGNGRRFREAGYDCPKYEIHAHGKTLFEWSMISLTQFWRQGARAFFVAQREHAAVDFIHRHAALCGIAHVDVLETDGLTDGQATSALLAGQALANKHEPMAVFNIDTYVDPRFLLPQQVRGEGWIPCFPGEGEGWSFARVDEHDRVVELREKKRISPWATIGLYCFGSFNAFEQTYAAHFVGSEGLEKGERYIAPMYNTLIQGGAAVYIDRLPLEAVRPMGTPAELKAFEAALPPASGAAC